MENDNTKLIVLKGVSVIFSELTDKGYGRSITIDATEKAVQEKISAWVKANDINGGKPKFKEYTNKKDGKTTTQYNFKLSEYTQFGGRVVDGVAYGEKDLGYGAVINLQARAFEYKNKYGEGISSSIDGIFILEPAKNTVMGNIAE